MNDQKEIKQPNFNSSAFSLMVIMGIVWHRKSVAATVLGPHVLVISVGEIIVNDFFCQPEISGCTKYKPQNNESIFVIRQTILQHGSQEIQQIDRKLGRSYYIISLPGQASSTTHMLTAHSK